MDKKLFLNLLYAICNIGGNAQPETDESIVYSESVLLMADNLFPSKNQLRDKMIADGYGGTQLQRDEFDPNTVAIDDGVFRDGQIKAVELWLECMKCDNPKSYAKAEIVKGLAGDRVE